MANPRATRDFLRARLRDREHEVFCCLFLDNRHRVIAFEEVFRGTIDGASVHPREVVKLALARNAAAVILAHNHPSGVAEPSQADELITGRLRDALALVDIRVLDHIVVGDGRCVSFAERGLCCRDSGCQVPVCPVIHAWYKTPGHCCINTRRHSAARLLQDHTMSRVCQVTGKRPMGGNTVSHANNRKRRRFLPNLHKQRFWLEDEKRWVRLRVSGNGLRTIEKNGIEAVVGELRAQGVKV